MRKVRIYEPGVYHQGQTLALSANAVQHLHVLRLQQGNTFILFGGDNHEYLATITDLQKRKITVQLGQQSHINRESPRKIELAQAISKGDRMEWVVQKAVELGCEAIKPLITARCVVRLDEDRLEKKRLQWQAIAIAACEQSGRNQIPVIHTPQTLKQYLSNRTHSSHTFILDPYAVDTLPQSLSEGDICLLIGPEGGFTEDEIAFATLSGTRALRLGPRVLRTETAAIAALTILQARYGDLT